MRISINSLTEKISLKEMSNLSNRVIAFTDSDSPFLGAINMIKEIANTEYCSLIIYNFSEGQVKWHYANDHRNNINENTPLIIPEEFLASSIDNKELLFISKNSNSEKGLSLPPGFPLQQLMIIPLSGKHLNALVVIGDYENRKKLNSKRKIRKLTAFLKSSEYLLGFLNKYDKAHELSFKDDLTKAYNRRYLDRCLREELNRATRNSSKLSFIFFDLNDFRAFNDSYGHYYGSRLLVYITHKIMDNVRDIDKFVRYGGDEFCVILPDTSVDGAIIVSKRILEVLKKLDFPTPDGRKVVLSACFGVSSFPDNAKNVKDLICEADRAMYSAKENGKDIVVITREISEKMQKRNIDV
jgi:diguanylate cyclase (GGDEF)-like protein